MLSSSTLLEARRTYTRVLAGKPPEAERPTDRQLSALSAWLLAAPGGRYRAPTVCFSLWGAYGNVTFEDRAFAPRQVTVDGVWAPLRYKGPGDYASWRKCWDVYETAMIMLGAATPASLHEYKTGLRS